MGSEPPRHLGKRQTFTLHYLVGGFIRRDPLLTTAALRFWVEFKLDLELRVEGSVRDRSKKRG